MWRLVVPVVPSSMLGAWLGSALAAQLDGRVLQVGLALVLLFSAWRLTRQAEPVAQGDGRPARSLVLWAMMGLGVGLFSGLSGLAGGVVIIPALALLGKLPSRFLAATSAGRGDVHRGGGRAGLHALRTGQRHAGRRVRRLRLPARGGMPGGHAIPMAQVGAR